ncbi:MAG: RNA recognition motif domain-containing protein [Candidatus Altimarinota bacterium]
MKKLYIGNISYNTTEESLKEAFSAFGEVMSAQVIKDKFSGRSKGFGFVEMNDDEAMAAIDKMNDSELDGRKIIVNEARPLEDRPPRRDFGGGGDRRGGGGGFGGGGSRRF